ncbi:hypothetical protein [Nonomuraea sp. NPDC049750]|uniref:hypothetical protein n=1 Tax=Nonomuraea sp. NPDC049750 TaxID=3154738 RepID=UPI0033DE2A32
MPSDMRVRRTVGQSVNSVPSTVRPIHPSRFTSAWAACSRCHRHHPGPGQARARSGQRRRRVPPPAAQRDRALKRDQRAEEAERHQRPVLLGERHRRRNLADQQRKPTDSPGGQRHGCAGQQWHPPPGHRPPRSPLSPLS